MFTALCRENSIIFFDSYTPFIGKSKVNYPRPYWLSAIEWGPEPRTLGSESDAQQGTETKKISKSSKPSLGGQQSISIQ